MNKLLIAGQTDVGQRRQDNQDTFICRPGWSDASALLVVIDGVGGYAGGDRAAAIARDSIERYMAAPNGDPLTMLREAVVFANNQINEQRQQDPALGQMCCVLTAAVADAGANRLSFVHVGDTRLYRFRQDRLDKLTADHSLVGIREDASELTEAEAMQHPRRNEILREVGSATHRVDDPDFLDSGETDFLTGDLLLLCSDGLTDMITQAQIVGVLNRSLSLDKQVTGLIKLANKQGGNDNITVVLAKNNAKPAEKTSVMPPVSLPDSGEVPAQSTRAEAPDVAEQPGSTTTTAPPMPAKRTKGSVWAILGLGVLLGGILALLAFIWYQSGQADQSAVATTTNGSGVALPDSAVATVAKRSRLDSLVQQASLSPGHRLLLPGDTFRLTRPLLLTDSLHTVIGGVRPTVLIPADTAQSGVALRVMRGSVTLENLVISGFKTGIETTGPVQLHVKQVYFRGVNLPVSAAVRQDTFRNAVMTISVQDQPNASVLPKPTRR